MLKITNTPQRIEEFFEDFKHIFTTQTYQSFVDITQAIINSQKRKTVTNLHKGIANPKSRTAYSYFFNNAKFKNQKIAQTKANIFFEKHNTENSKIILSIDDTLTKKEGKKTDGVGKFHDHSNGEYIKANNFVTSSIQINDNYIPHTVKMYKKEKHTDSENFKTKIEIAYENIIEPLETPNNSTLYIVYDSWWFSSDNIEDIQDLDHHVVCLLKSDKRFQVNDSSVRVDEFSDMIEYDEISTENDSYYAYSEIVKIPDVGRVKLVYAKESDDSDEYKCIMCTNVELSIREIIDMYVNRWNIETVHKESDDKLGFGDYQMRNEKAIERYIQLCFLCWFISISILDVFDSNRDDVSSGDFGVLSVGLDRVRFEYLVEAILSILDEFLDVSMEDKDRVDEVVSSLFWSRV